MELPISEIQLVKSHMLPVNNKYKDQLKQDKIINEVHIAKTTVSESGTACKQLHYINKSSRSIKTNSKSSMTI